MKKFLYWAPRVLAIIITALTSIFAFDVFNEGYSGAELVTALFMHLLPTLVLIGNIVVAWKWEHIGGWGFIVIGIVLVVVAGFEPLGVYLFTILLCLIGAMFLVYYYKYKKGANESASQSTG